MDYSPVIIKLILARRGVILNSWNQVEVFCRENSAENKLKLKTGQTVTLKVK
jgi:S-adenosylmethionine hydrolase